MSKKDPKPSKMKNLFKLGFRKSTTDLSEWSKNDEKLMKAVETADLAKISQYLAKKMLNPTKLGPKGMSVFHVACQLGRADVVDLLIAQGAEVNVLSIQGNTSLQIASREGWPHIVERLIEAGGVIDHKDGMSLTALHHSCVRGQVPCVQVLLKHGADPNVRDKTGKPPLFYSAYSGFLPICKELLDKGAKVNATDEQKLTPLMAASKQGNADVCEFLLKKGADPALLDVHGQDALTYGLNEGFEDLGEVFRKAPARASWDVQQSAQDSKDTADAALPKVKVEEVISEPEHIPEEDKDNMVAKFVPEATPEVHRKAEQSTANDEGELDEEALAERAASPPQSVIDQRTMEAYKGELDEEALAERAASPPQSVIDQRTMEAYKELEEENEQMNEDLKSLRYKNKQLQEAYDGLKRQLSKPEVPPVDQEEVQELEDELSALKSQLSEEQDKNIRLIDKMKVFRKKYKGEGENSDDDSWNDSDDEIFEQSTLTRKTQVVEHKPQTLLLLQNQVSQLRQDNKHLRERLQLNTGSVSSLASIEDPFSLELEKMQHKLEVLETDKQKLQKQIEEGNILPEEHQQNIAILEQENSGLHSQVKQLKTEINELKTSSEKQTHLPNGDLGSGEKEQNYDELVKSAIQNEQVKSINNIPSSDSTEETIELKRQKETLQTENSLLTEELDSLRETYSKLVIAGDNLQDQYDQLVMEKEHVHEELEIVAKAKQELAKENEYLLTDANAMHDDIDRLVQEVEKVHDLNQKITKEKEELEHQFNSLSVTGGKASDFARITEERDKLKERAEELETLNDELKKNHDIVLEEVQSLQETVQRIEYEREQLQQEFDSLQDEFENIQGSNEGLQQDYNQLEQDYSDLLADKEKLEQDFLDVQTASVNVEHTNPALNAEMDKIRQDNSDLIMEKEQLEMTMTELSKSNALIQEELNSLKEALKLADLDKKKDVEKKNNEISVSEQKSSQLSSSINSTSSDNSDKTSVDAIVEKDRRIRSLQIQISRLQQQLAESDKHYREVISTYRTHLLSAVQGHMDPEVKQALYNIIELRSTEQFC